MLGTRAFLLLCCQAAARATHHHVPVTLMAGGSAGWERRPGSCSVKVSALQGMAKSHHPPTALLVGTPSQSCPCFCCLELSHPGPVCLSLSLLPVSAHSPHPTRCVLSSALEIPPGSRALPRGISVRAGAWEQFRKLLRRTGISVPSPEWRNEFPPPSMHRSSEQGNIQSTDS